MTDGYRDAFMRRPLSDLLSADGRRGPELLWEIDSMESVDQLRVIFNRLTKEISIKLEPKRGKSYPPWPFPKKVTAGGPTVEEARRATRAVFFMLYHWPKPDDLRSSDETDGGISEAA